jgi:hypothetical protein
MTGFRKLTRITFLFAVVRFAADTAPEKRKMRVRSGARRYQVPATVDTVPTPGPVIAMNMMNSQEGGYKPTAPWIARKKTKAAVMLPAICT